MMQLLHRYSWLKQRMIAERFGGLDEGLVSRDRRAIREKIETEPLAAVFRLNVEQASSSVNRHSGRTCTRS